MIGLRGVEVCDFLGVLVCDLCDLREEGVLGDKIDLGVAKEEATVVGEDKGLRGVLTFK